MIKKVNEMKTLVVYYSRSNITKEMEFRFPPIVLIIIGLFIIYAAYERKNRYY